jgi:4-aminobutyrate aminotransferase-like enzyme
VTELGRRTIQEFNSTAQRSENIGEVRGVGFMIGNEIIKTKKEKNPSKELAVKMRKYMFEHGLLMHTRGHFGNVLRFMAPLTISEQLLSKGLEIYEQSARTVR